MSTADALSDAVQDVLDYLASSMTVAEILADFPDLTEEDIRACLAYAAEKERNAVMAFSKRENCCLTLVAMRQSAHGLYRRHDSSVLEQNSHF